MHFPRHLMVLWKKGRSMWFFFWGGIWTESWKHFLFLFEVGEWSEFPAVIYSWFADTYGDRNLPFRFLTTFQKPMLGFWWYIIFTNIYHKNQPNMDGYGLYTRSSSLKKDSRITAGCFFPNRFLSETNLNSHRENPIMSSQKMLPDLD